MAAAARTLLHASAAPCTATRSSSAMLMLISSPNSCPCFCLSQPWLHNTTPMAAVTVLVRGRGRRPTMVRCSSSAAAAVVPTQESVKSLCEKYGTMSLLEKLRERFIKDSAKESQSQSALKSKSNSKQKQATQIQEQTQAQDFAELGLSDEVLSALEELKINVPTEVQSLGIRAILKGHSIVLASHTGSGKTLAYMLPLIQMFRKDESETGKQMKPKRPRAVVLCPTRELCEQVFHVAKSLSHHARFRSTMISGGVRMKPQVDALNCPLEMVVGTPGRLLQHINEGNMFYGDIKYVVIDEADTMFDHGFGPDLRKFLNPLRNKASKPGDGGFQSILVTATITRAVQKLLDEEFQGITHVHTSTLHKRISTAFHDFIKLSGSENKLEALLQVLEPSLAKGNKVMVFCNTLDSSRAVDHFLNENQLLTVNYHGEVPAEKRVENLNKFKSDDPDCPTLVCTDLAARGLDLAVDHVIMFDFPLNPIDYLHRTGRTARMGAKGKVTSLVTKKDMILASKIEDAIRKNESLESLTAYKDKPQAKKQNENRSNKDSATSRVKNSGKPLQSLKSGKVTSSKVGAKPKVNLQKKSKTASTHKSKTTVKISNTMQNDATKKSKMNSSARPSLSKKTKQTAKVWKSEKPLTTRLSVIGFKGRKTS